MKIAVGDIVLYHGGLFKVYNIVVSLGIEVEALDGSCKVGILFSEEFMIAHNSNRLKSHVVYYTEPSNTSFTNTLDSYAIRGNRSVLGEIVYENIDF